MKQDGLHSSYSYLKDEYLFCFSDVITLANKIKEIDFKLERYSIFYFGRNDLKIKKNYYTKLGEAILKGIGSNYKIENYLKFDFKLIKEYSSLFWGLLMLREKYYSFITSFSGDHVGDRWENTRLFPEKELIRNEVIFYRESINLYKEKIKNIDLIIGNNIQENTVYVSLFDLKNKHNFDIDLGFINDELFSL